MFHYWTVVVHTLYHTELPAQALCGQESLLLLRAWVSFMWLSSLPKKILYCNKLRRNFFSKDFERDHQYKCVIYSSGQSSGLSWGSGSTGDREVSLDQRKAPNTLWFLLPKISHGLDGYLVSLCQETKNSTILSTCSDLDCGFVSY